MAAATAVVVATLLLTVAPPTQPAVATTGQSSPAAQAAVQQTLVLEAVQPAAKSLAVPPSMITTIAWKTTTGPSLTTSFNLDQTNFQVPFRVLQGKGCPCKGTYVLKLSFINL